MDNDFKPREFELETSELQPENFVTEDSDEVTKPIEDKVESEETKPIEENLVSEETTPVYEENDTKPVAKAPVEGKKGSKKTLVAIIITAVALLGCCGGAYYFLTKSPKYEGGTWKALFKKVNSGGAAYDSNTEKRSYYNY